MKKKVLLAVLMVLIVTFSSVLPALAEMISLSLKVGDPYMMVGSARFELDPGRGTKPVIINGRTLIPVRTIINKMGGTIGWDSSLRQIVIFANNKTIKMTLNNKNASIKPIGAANWSYKNIDVAPQSINGRTMVPLRFVSEELGAKVDWNNATKKITLTFSPSSPDLAKWTGVWQTDIGLIVFNQAGTDVTATCDNIYLGKITGTDSNRMFSGKWYVDELEQGDIVLTLSRDGNTFTGKYKNSTPTSSGKYTYDDSESGWTEITGSR